MEVATLETSLKEIKSEILAKIEEHRSASGAKSKQLEDAITQLQRQADAIDASLADRIGAGSARKSIDQMLREDEAVAKIMRDKKGSCVVNFQGADVALLEQKTTITSSAVGSQTTGVLRIDRMGGITAEARQQLRLRDVLVSRPTSLQIIDYVKVNNPMSIASPQTEASAKAENQVTFTSESERVQTIATWVPASRQVLDDFVELGNFINDSLMYYTNLAEELQMLTGAGTGTDLNGLITQATAFDTALLTGSWTRIDVIGAAIEQLNIAKELDPTFCVLNPTDLWRLRRTKDSENRYLMGDPASVGAARLWNLDLIATNNISAGTFLVGSGNPEATLVRDRMESQIEISASHSDYFTKNLIAVRCEKRLALVTRRPASFITGTFTTSP